GDGGPATFENGSALSHDTLLRLTCDARIQFVLDGEKQQPIGVGRTTRTIPPWLARLVKARDKGCRFPGCGRTRWVQVHHIIHWSRGGRTDLDNLITLCGQHHRMLHEQGWTITGHPGRNITWLRPGGDPFTPKPPAYPLQEWRRFLAGAAPVYPPDRPPDRPAVAAPV
ncbi:MAG: HNH endonuclease, partial [Acidimicrobiia bacterium]|nr:HNH endonuclease [Acidimicrobiia bacterium]